MTSLAQAAVKNVVLVHGAFADGSGWKPVATILERDEMTALSVVRYVLESRADHNARFDQVISANCTRGLSDDLLGVTRIKRTQECSIRNNIEIFLDKLSTLDLN